MRGCSAGNASASLKAAITTVRQQSSGAMRCMCRWYASVAAALSPAAQVGGAADRAHLPLDRGVRRCT
jgi:hypothetical protein